MIGPLPHHQIRPGGAHRPRGRDQAPHRRLGQGRARRTEASPRPHLRRPRRRGEDLAGGEVGGGAGAPGLAGVRRRLRVVLLQPGHARADRRLVRYVSGGGPQLLRRPGDGGQRAGRVRQRPAAGPACRRAAGAPHPRWPWNPCNTRPPRPRRASSRTRASRPYSKGWLPPVTASASSPPGMPSPICAPSGRPPRPCTSCRVSRRPPA